MRKNRATLGKHIIPVLPTKYIFNNSKPRLNIFLSYRLPFQMLNYPTELSILLEQIITDLMFLLKILLSL